MISISCMTIEACNKSGVNDELTVNIHNCNEVQMKWMEQIGLRRALGEDASTIYIPFGKVLIVLFGPPLPKEPEEKGEDAA